MSSMWWTRSVKHVVDFHKHRKACASRFSLLLQETTLFLSVGLVSVSFGHGPHAPYAGTSGACPLEYETVKMGHPTSAPHLGVLVTGRPTAARTACDRTGADPKSGGEPQ
jgi:hypothetical protein